MITRAIVRSKPLTDYSEQIYKVYIPILHNNNDKEENLLDAVLCTLPGVKDSINVNDVVVVAFEDNDAGRPIILGHLAIAKKLDENREAAMNSKDYQKFNTDTRMTLDLDSLKVSSDKIGSVQLPTNTTIGGVNIFNSLQGILSLLEIFKHHFGIGGI